MKFFLTYNIRRINNLRPFYWLIQQTEGIVFFLFVLLGLSFLPNSSNLFAQFQFQNDQDNMIASEEEFGPRLGSSVSQIYRAGIVIQPGAQITNAEITIPIPMEWPEQKIIKIDEEKTDAALSGKIRYRTVNDGAQEMILNLGRMRPHRPVEIVLAFELENFEVLPPERTDVYVIPKQARKKIAQYLKESPKIECENKKRLFEKMFRDITKDKETDWEKVEAIYRFVQDKVRYNEAGRAREALGAYAVTQMKEGEWEGDCKDMCCLFVAICRAGKVPARLVRVPEHCYAEFYLELKEGVGETITQEQDNEKPARRRAPAKMEAKGFWFPCQVAGTYAFGGVPETRVILQKGDSYPDKDKEDPKSRARKLFLYQCFSGELENGSPEPKYIWVDEVRGK